MQIHEPGNRDSLKPYYCTVCDARCADINQMVRHRAIHTENKPFSCKHCDYKTRWKKDLKTHEMIHTGEFKCSYEMTLYMSPTIAPTLHQKHHFIVLLIIIVSIRNI